MSKIILASASPRRQELLKQIGIDFDVIPSIAEEKYQSTSPADIVKELSLQKASEVAERISICDNQIIIGADTIVTKDGKILGKPKDEEDAYQMLSSLQGTTHQVYSGVALLIYNSSQKIIKNFYEMTSVTFEKMNSAQIKKYIATKDPMDKAGAYGIQGCFAEYIRGISGDYYNVVGLPLAHLMKELREYL